MRQRQLPPRKYGLGQFLVGLGFFVVCFIWFQLGSLVGCLFWFPAVGMPFGVVVMLAGLFTMLTGKIVWDFTKSPQYQRTFNEERARYERQRALSQQQQQAANPPSSPAMPVPGAPHGQPQTPVSMPGYPTAPAPAPGYPPTPMYAPPSAPQGATFPPQGATLPAAYPPQAYQQAPAYPPQGYAPPYAAPQQPAATQQPDVASAPYAAPAALSPTYPVSPATAERRGSRGLVIGLLVVLALGVVGLGIVHLFTAPNTQTYTDSSGLFKVTMPYTWSSPSFSMTDHLASLAGTDHAVSWFGDQRYFDVAYTGNQVGDQTTLQRADDAILQADATTIQVGLPANGSLADKTAPHTVTIGGVSWLAEEADIVDNRDPSGNTAGHEVVLSTYHAGSLVSIVYGVAHAADFASARSDDFQPILASFHFLK